MQSRTQFMRRFGEIYRPFTKDFAGALVITAITTTFALLPPYLQGRVVDAQKLGLFAKAALFILLAGAMIFVLGVMDVVRGMYQNRRLDFRLDRFSSHLALGKVFSFSIGQHLNQNSGITQSVVVKGRHSMNTLVYTMLFQVMPTLTTMAIATVALLIMAPVPGLVVVLGTTLYVADLLRNNRKMYPEFKAIDDREHRFAKKESEAFQHASLVIASGQEERIVEECDRELESIQGLAEALWHRYLKKWIGRHGLGTATWVLASMLAAYYVQVGKYSIGFMVMIWSWIFQVESNASQVGWMLRQVLKLYPAVAKFFELLDIESDVKAVAVPVRPEKFEGKIEFRNVTMHYPTRPWIVDEEDGPTVVEPTTTSKDPALAAVNFTINPGERVAIVGESGAGKTTLVQALLRAQDPDEGQILIDGHDLRLLDPKHFREAVGFVEQHVPLFDDSLRYNITFGLNGRGKDVSEADLADIARLASIDRFMDRLANGFDTVIGERGIKLSGGERQRVAIARALIKRPAILIFDEATSNLDPQNELLIRESIERASIGRTTIIIAHRFSTIRAVDKVIVMDRGKVVGIGSHEELAATCPCYQQLIQPQIGVAVGTSAN